MEPSEAQAVIRNLPRGRTPFPYFKDRYAFLLLSYAVGTRLSIDALRLTPFARLINKPAVRRALARAGGRAVHHDLFAGFRDEPAIPYALTLGRWGLRRSRWPSDWYQTSRPGENLVLQLNFSDAQARAYAKLARPRDRHPFVSPHHPVRADDCLTLAWARIDLELDAGEALIEEIQNDWVRSALSLRDRIERNMARGEPAEHDVWPEFGGSVSSLLAYFDQIIGPVTAVWAQAMLAAAIWFLRSELSIHRIYFHTYESGLRMKGLCPCCGPPRSVYTALPEQFCFQRTSATPAALQRCAHPGVRAAAGSGLEWYVLEL